MTLVQFNSKDHPGHWESHTAWLQVLRFVLLSFVRVLWETRKSISFILNLDCSSSWTFTKAAGPRGGTFQNAIWSQGRTLRSQMWHHFIENRQWVLDLISTFTPCRHVPFPHFLETSQSVLETEDVIYFYHLPCQTGQLPQGSAFRCSKTQENHNEEPFISVAPSLFPYLILRLPTVLSYHSF